MPAVINASRRLALLNLAGIELPELLLWNVNKVAIAKSFLVDQAVGITIANINFIEAGTPSSIGGFFNGVINSE
jgi:hypothetical protein